MCIIVRFIARYTLFLQRQFANFDASTHLLLD